MESIADLISDLKNGSTKLGRINRFKYLPYKMDVALSVIERIGKGITPDFNLSDVQSTYMELIKYFHADPDYNGDLTKGILLMGPTGTGKTLAMQIMNVYRQIDDIRFSQNGKVYKMNYEITDVNQLASYFMESAFDGIDIYCRRYVVCLDDIGTEQSSVKHFGNNLDVVGHVLAERYAKGLLTFGTTNFPLKMLEEKYEDRIVSRMYALFNFMILKHADYRKNIKIA